ncbi:MAG: hypothetical protein CVU48_03840 [Candidatus Cloacimonetes bacterium HGW-Cloacimonetes-1]|jgi:3-methyladenine DNA glycosylase AlkC|nr:MAG: hypothetical protein CVU48_03840 [Candidatus Cloacimonetes bacterium HGW-Cloacimonetes-1]
MIKAVGRLNIDEIKELDSETEKIFRYLDQDKEDLAKKKILKISNTPNYFVREEFGKRLAQYTGTGPLDTICSEMLEDHLYGIRATGLFYFYNKRQSEPEIIVKTIEKTFETVPWESETIAFEMWKRHSGVMKKYMPIWAESPNEKKRAISMHGMENIASKNPQFVLNFVYALLDDESDEVQKKVSHILTQVGRQRPLQCYTNVRKWLIGADEKRVKTIWQTMKKLANIFAQRSKRDKTYDFINITQKTVQEWRTDSNPAVASMGAKLAHIIGK